MGRPRFRYELLVAWMIAPYRADCLLISDVHGAFQFSAPSVIGRMKSSCWPGLSALSIGWSILATFSALYRLSALTQLK